MKKLLLVDDDRDFTESLAELLQDYGYRVETAFAGEEAVRRAGEFDVTLMDISMPGRDGIDCLRAIRSAEPAARVIMMTGFTRAELVEQAHGEGAFGVLYKPLDIDRLLHLIEDDKGA